ncbi:hypothetical protein Bca52824_013928 [Brassica carinata]|uniref:Uncharacterized protein n=1 Tax=Brassica carinata TaxID=52824 RepID=A0A8X7W1W2_BRACI|nr:hypothetical protein Bca52824_013928 [Brassica carinata]
MKLGGLVDYELNTSVRVKVIMLHKACDCPDSTPTAQSDLHQHKSPLRATTTGGYPIVTKHLTPSMRAMRNHQICFIKGLAAMAIHLVKEAPLLRLECVL